MPNFKDITGQRFGRLVAIQPAGIGASHYMLWSCQCDCGNTCTVNGGRLRSSRTRSCGCLGEEQRRENGKRIARASCIYDCDCGIRGRLTRSAAREATKICRCPPEPLTQARLRELLHYDPETGFFTWRVSTAQSVQTGDRAGSMSSWGYWRIEVEGRRYKSHQLSWLYVYGQFPEKRLDHKNRNRTDNRIANLREATPPQNNANSKTQRNNTSGLKGAHWRGGRHKHGWRSTVTYNRKRIHLGIFPTPELAHAAYCQAAKELYGEFFCDGKDRETP